MRERGSATAITMHDVARVADVSITTVSNVVTDYRFIRPETRQGVQSAIDELGYRPNLSARGLRSGRIGVISLIVPDLRNAYFAERAVAVMRAADAKKLAVVIEQSGDRRETELELLRGPRLRMVDGILCSVLAFGEDRPICSRTSRPRRYFSASESSLVRPIT